MPGRFVLSFIDETRETATASVNGATLNAVNFDAQIALQDALQTAIEAVTLGNVWQLVRQASAVRLTQVPPVSKAAQRECKCLIQYEDAITKKRYGVELPTFDLTLLKLNSDEVDLTAGAGLALKTAFEAYAQSPYGNDCVILKITHVGRRT